MKNIEKVMRALGLRGSKRPWRAVAALLLALLVSGCGSSNLSGSETALVGLWKVDVASLPTPMPMPNFSNNPDQQASFERGFKIGQDMAREQSLDIKSDRTFSLMMGTVATTGTWVFDEATRTLTLTTLKVGNMDMSAGGLGNRPMTFMLGQDGHLTAPGSRTPFVKS